MCVYFYSSPCDPQTSVVLTNMQELLAAIKADIEAEEEMLDDGCDPKLSFAVEFADLDEAQIEALPDYQGP